MSLSMTAVIWLKIFKLLIVLFEHLISPLPLLTTTALLYFQKICIQHMSVHKTQEHCLFVHEKSSYLFRLKYTTKTKNNGVNLQVT